MRFFAFRSSVGNGYFCFCCTTCEIDISSYAGVFGILVQGSPLPGSGRHRSRAGIRTRCAAGNCAEGFKTRVKLISCGHVCLCRRCSSCRPPVCDTPGGGYHSRA